MLRKGWKTIGTILLICMLCASFISISLQAEETVTEEDNTATEVVVAEDVTEEETETEATNEESAATTTAYKSGQTEATVDSAPINNSNTAISTGSTARTAQNAPITASPASVKKAAPSPRIDIKKNKITIKKGTKKQLKFSVANTSKRNITWTSSDKSVAKVNSQGVVKVLSGGKCVITARVKGTNIEDSIVVKGKDYYIIRVRTTGYCNCGSCAGPWAGCRTASGKYPRANHTIAVDRRLIKLGTKVKIGRVTYVAEDVGSGIRGRSIDIYYSSHSRAHRHGVKWQLAKVYF